MSDRTHRQRPARTQSSAAGWHQPFASGALLAPASAAGAVASYVIVAVTAALVFPARSPHVPTRSREALSGPACARARARRDLEVRSVPDTWRRDGAVVPAVHVRGPREGARRRRRRRVVLQRRGHRRARVAGDVDAGPGCRARVAVEPRSRTAAGRDPRTSRRCQSGRARPGGCTSRPRPDRARERPGCGRRCRVVSSVAVTAARCVATWSVHEPVMVRAVHVRSRVARPGQEAIPDVASSAGDAERHRVVVPAVCVGGRASDPDAVGGGCVVLIVAVAEPARVSGLVRAGARSRGRRGVRPG